GYCRDDDEQTHELRGETDDDPFRLLALDRRRHPPVSVDLSACGCQQHRHIEWLRWAAQYTNPRARIGQEPDYHKCKPDQDRPAHPARYKASIGKEREDDR